MAEHVAVLELTGTATSRRRYLGELRSNLGVLVVLARKEFQTRYKRASLGVVWAVLVPVIQAGVMAFIFSRVVRFETEGVPYAPVVMTGIVTYAYAASAVSAGATAIVDNSSITQRVWFPRAVLGAVPPLANLVSYAISLVFVFGIGLVLGAEPGVHLVLLPLAAVLAAAFAASLAVVLSALHVYFRDVRYMVQAALLVWMWVTPIVYQKSTVGTVGPYLDLNPMTGVVSFARLAMLGYDEDPWVRPTLVTLAWVVVLAVVALEVHRRQDRLFVDHL